MSGGHDGNRTRNIPFAEEAVNHFGTWPNCGVPEKIRTSDLSLRRAALYSTELQAHIKLLARPAGFEPAFSAPATVLGVESLAGYGRKVYKQ